MAMIKHVNLSNFKFDIDFEDQCICWTTFFAMRLLPCVGVKEQYNDFISLPIIPTNISAILIPKWLIESASLQFFKPVSLAAVRVLLSTPTSPSLSSRTE